MPSKDQLRAMSSQMSEQTIELVHRLDDIKKRDFRTIIPQAAYHKTDIAKAADLLEKLLDWVPSKRVSCEKALQHSFFKE
jgi:DNA-directed RNA polymerase specialized sigma54-like protein